MADPPPPLVRALFDLGVYDEVSLMLEDATELGATVTVEPSYHPFDPHREAGTGLAPGALYADALDLRPSHPPSARLLLDAIERRVWEQPSVNVYDPETEHIEEETTQIVRNRWRSLGTLIGIEDRINGEG